ncbi:MAG TPA: hypothetical protein VKT81_08960 [Bryobacteraceae bacterium]|nr:hypothetical protein [Bryobacteraceae bacterium]
MRRAYGLVSFLIGIPCVWQLHIQAGDLSSHLYNAWLANQVSDGRLPGLYIVPQFTNVLFDHLLSFLMRLGGPLIAEKIAVLLAVEIFFWGCFALASAMAGRPAWNATPFLAIAAYGAVFRMGFFNFYLAVGLCSWAIALVWRNHPRFRWLAIPLLVLAYTAHSIACIWAIGVIGYLLIARRLRATGRYVLLTASALSIAGAARIVAVYIQSRWAPGLHIGALLGANQALIYGPKYKLIDASLFCLCVFLLIRRLEASSNIWQDSSFQLLFLNAVAVLCFPDGIWFPQYHVRLTYIAIRLSLFSAILFCGVVGRLKMYPAEKAISATLLVFFFSFLYADERAINFVEQEMSRAIGGLPVGARVVAPLTDAGIEVPALQHLIDRVCIGRCFDFADYEPPTAQFRLRARPGNSYVMTSISDVLNLENAEYVWTNNDIQLYRLAPCDAAKEFCAHVVQPGERLTNQQVDATPHWWTPR